MTERNKNQEILAKIIVKAWKDEAFKEKLKNNPQEVFKECGFEVPENKKIKILEETASQSFLIIPERPLNSHELMESDLENLSGGACITAYGGGLSRWVQ